jgi:DNA topoisomerase-1
MSPTGTGRNLVIVESNAKSSTIEKILGENYVVASCRGHVKDLPKKELGVDIPNGFEPTYVADAEQEKVLSKLRKLAESADLIFLATDPDREGEAISYHLYQELGGDGKKILRITFNEITAAAVRGAIAAPRDIDIGLIDAQQARRVLDRLVGYKISPVLWKKVRKGLSAGRVQSVAVRLICEREEEIELFEPAEYWSISGVFEGRTGDQFEAMLAEVSGESMMTLKNTKRYKRRIATEAEAEEILEAVRGGTYKITSVEKKRTGKSPKPPFITSTLQQLASSRLGFTGRRTMAVAQRLYEGVDLGAGERVGLITYMRTDSTRVAGEAVSAARRKVEDDFGGKYLPEKPRYYKSKKGAQDAHEAIRPTYMDRGPDSIKKYLSPDEYALYDLIYRRFIASQMADSVFDNTTIKIEGGDYLFRAAGSVMLFDGYLAAFPEDKADDVVLPDVTEGEEPVMTNAEKKQHFTKPPPRYTDATLIAALEEKGIGRPSTYAPIVSTIIEREYVERRDRRFYPTELGRFVNELLIGAFPDVLNVGFTAHIEEDLDAIADGQAAWREVIAGFYGRFSEDLSTAETTMDGIRECINRELVVACPECGGKLVLKFGKSGAFLGCANFPDCKYTTNYARADDGSIEIEKPEETDEICEECGAPMAIKNGRYGKFLACSRYPECKFTRAIMKKLDVKCPLCGGQLVERYSKKGRRRKFYGCENYPECKFTSPSRPLEKTCPDCGNPYMLKGKKGEYCPNKDCPSRAAKTAGNEDSGIEDK